MSAAPSLPPDFHLPAEPPRRPPGRWNWKRVAAWVGAAVLSLIAVVVIAVVVLLHSQSFHRYVLRVAQQKASSSLGSQVQVRDFTLQFSGISPTLDLYEVVVHGAPPYANPPLLTADHVKVAMRIVSLIQRTWYLNEIEIERPVARLFTDARGNDNLPKTTSSGQSRTSVFDLGIRHARLDRGEVYYNNRKSALDADLHDLHFQSVYDTAARQYSGTLGYRDGHLRLGAYRPIPHNLETQFAATPAAFNLQRAVLASGRSQFVLSATVEDYANPRVRATYDAVLDTGEFRRILRNPSVPSGTIRLAGSMVYVSEPNRPMLETLALNGSLSSPALAVRTPSLQTEVRNLGARYALSHGNLEVHDLRAHLLGGELTGTLTTRNLTGASRSQMRAALRNVSLSELKPMMNSPSLQQVSVAGSANAEASAAWGKTLDDLVAKADATVQATITPTPGTTGAAPTRVPLNGVLHARYSAPTKQLTLAQSYVRLPATSLALNGTISQRSVLAVRMQSNDLHELETVADAFRRPAAGQPPQPLGLYGTASFAGTVRGSTSAPQLTGQLTATNLRLRNSAWRLLRTNVNLSPSAVSLQNGQLQPADRGRVTFDLRAGLTHWSFTETSPVQVRMNASNINIAAITKAAGSQVVAQGTLSADVSIHGSALNPMGQGSVKLSPAKIADQAIPPLNLTFEGTGNEVHAKLTAQLQTGVKSMLAKPAVAEAVVKLFPQQRAYDGQLQITGVQLEKLPTQKVRDLQLSGVASLTATGRGTFSNPELQARLQVPQLGVHGQTISGFTVQTAVANHVANIALDSEVVNTVVRGRGTIHLTDNYDANVTLDTQSIPLQPLVAAFVPSQASNIAGQTELHASLRGPLKNQAQLEAHVTIPTLAVNYRNTVQIGAPSPIHLDYTRGVLQLQRASLRGTGTDLQFQGTIPTTGTAPVSLLLLGTIDLRLAQLLDPDVVSAGQVRFNINSYGQRANPDVQGQINIVNASFATGTVPIGLQNGNGVLTLTKDRLDITRFEGEIGGGTVTASGGVLYRPAMQFDLAVAGRNIRLLYPQGVRSATDLNLALAGTPQSALLRGQLRIEQLQFTPDFDLMSFAGQFGNESAASPAQGFSNNLRLDLGVASTSPVNLVSRTLSLQAAANLRVRGTAAEPVVLGRINLNGGDLIFNGNRYVLQSGTVDFVNASRTEPLLNVSVNTTIQQYNIGMRFEGPLDHMRTNYSSDPALPPADIIHLLAFGKTTEAAAANPAPGNLGAESAVASQVTGQVTSRVEKIAGISQLSVDPLMGCTQEARGACITIEQRVTSKIFVTFGTDVTQVQNETIKLEYQHSPRLSFSATREQNGGFGFDTRIHKSW